ncbi:helix-turn-helix transcriptional regulator [Pseudarthrobacter raffinosi]|uniref:helix-turn-helix transcriptional regulator n=1 Tax=Pseudarthrobacter raffinosi TaxID=2953651 RepID=UPI00208EFD6D|nr:MULTISPECIES: helix-turn-helix domain-containing protein [unclassified Pseudarthrobacter]MCO4239595.1 winged helix-turn-helix domain-containing protein [Pseudarthrobacter sp. MDT3-28]MCO4253559.1 winged helix-turn-helix domain-containing protein [Pseudarthrobacter sp. MDT3-9]MCO4264987.1 winged helix-turn-helix domain-containing protein [Pseudarthrobacter sp. MDT3-26]
MATKDFDSGTPAGAAAETQWTFLTNHAHVLLTIARDPQIRMRDVATRVGVTERAAQKITADLVEAGYITRTRNGRRNSYTVATGRPFRHPVDAGHELDELLAVLVPEPTSRTLDT